MNEHISFSDEIDSSIDELSHLLAEHVLLLMKDIIVEILSLEDERDCSLSSGSTLKL